MKRQKQLFLSAVLSVVFGWLQPTVLQAQVHIGDNTDAVPGSLLDLTNKQNFGLLLLRIDITELDKIPDTFTDRAGDGPVFDLTGLIVYNSNDFLPDGVGLYIWDGTNWCKIKKEIRQVKGGNLVRFNYDAAGNRIGRNPN
jgi:hypothetical protein